MTVKNRRMTPLKTFFELAKFKWIPDFRACAVVHIVCSITAITALLHHPSVKLLLHTQRKAETVQIGPQFKDLFINGRNTPKISFFEITRQGRSNFTPGLDGGGFFGPYSFIILKSSHQDLSNEGSKKFLSSLELGF